jgi:hypothetical protein
VRILLDESTPRDLRKGFVGLEATTVARLGWTGITNGELLRRAAAGGFDVLVTADQNLRYQQNIPRSGIAVVVLRARSNRGEVIEVGGSPAR